MGNDLKNRVSFEFIRYANVWEDAELLISAFRTMGTNKKFLSIASAGDNCLMLLTLNPEKVVAVDVNPVQLKLVELKMATIKVFSYNETLRFLGFLPCENRIQNLEKLKCELTTETYNYWKLNANQIKNGIIHQGKFEKYFQMFSKRILPLIHTKKRINELFRNKSVTEQKDFYYNKWNNWRWKLLFKVFFSKYVMGKYGRDPEFLREVNLSVSKYIYMKAEKHLKSINAQSNFILYYNLNGRFDSFLPPYLQKENFEIIKSQLSKLELIQGYVSDAINKYGTFDGMNLSDIFEYMDKEVFLNESKKLILGANKNARICYWNLMVPRRISGILPESVNFKKELSQKATEMDKGFFYNQFIIDEVI